ncbi:MAG: putative zinc-binding protein [Methanocella sp.]
MDNKGKDMTGVCSCECSKAPKIIYACSGSSDVGEITDRAARQLSAEGAGKMSCIAGIGGRAGAMLDIANAASFILALDGCPQNCAKKTLELAGYRDFGHIGLYDLGLPKGKSPATEKNISKVVEKGRDQLSSK